MEPRYPRRIRPKYDMPFEEAKRLIRAQYEVIGEATIEWYNIDHWLKKFDLPVSANTLLDRYESHIEPFPDTKEVLEALMETYTLIVASNAARIFVDKELAYTDLTPYFTHIISATSDYGMVKKEAGFYEKLCATLNASPDEIVHVVITVFLTLKRPQASESMPTTLCMTDQRRVMNPPRKMEKPYIG